MWKHYFDHIDAVVFVVDSTDADRLFMARDELRKLLQQGEGGLGDVPFLLMYNKRDVPGKSSEELSGRLEVEALRAQGRQIII